LIFEAIGDFMIVTTAGRTNDNMVEFAIQAANELSIPFVERRKRSIEDIQTVMNDDVLVIGKNRLEIYSLYRKEPFFFHPNSSMFRIKRIMSGEVDPFIQTCGLKNGSTLLDCTLGLGSDSITASFCVGETGKVVGIEGNQYIAYIVAKGLQSWKSDYQVINEAMERVEVVYSDYLSYLQTCPSDSFDVVYFDPMFEESLVESDGISSMKQIALRSPLDSQIIAEAKRVAKTRVVMKDHWKSERFVQLGFTVFKRKTSKFHFGLIEI